MKEKNIKEYDADDVIIVTAPVKIDEGRHKGKISDLVRNLPNQKAGRMFDYVDILVQVTDHEKMPELSVGFPTNISELSSLGRLLIKSGLDFAENDQIKVSEIKDHLVGKTITFLSKNEKTEGGEFARILRDTIEFS